MIDPTPNEIAAMEAASPPAGEYIERIGKTDMTTFTYDEWMAFIEIIVTAYVDALIALSCRDNNRLKNLQAEAPF